MHVVIIQAQAKQNKKNGSIQDFFQFFEKKELCQKFKWTCLLKNKNIENILSGKTRNGNMKI